MGTFAFFLYGFIKEVGVGHVVLYTFLTIGLGFKILKVLYEWYHYLSIRTFIKAEPKRAFTVDVLTTACPEEPKEMVEATLRAMVQMRLPHESYLCDEGNDPYYRELCRELGVHHVTRTVRTNAKAGNINNALEQAKGEICVILDPDHVPAPDFLEQVLPHFNNPETGFVQVVQAYKNQKESLIARAAAEQTYIFYGPFMRGMSELGTAQAIGANCTFRREALDSIGGHAPGLTEDMHTSMLLHAKGWKSVYVPKIVSRGLVPSSLSAYYKQQIKWSRGTFDLLFHVYPKLFTKFTWKQKIHYAILPLYYFLGFVTLIDFMVPVFSLFTGEYPWQLNPAVFAVYFAPFIISGIFLRLNAQRWLSEQQEQGLHLAGGILRVGSWWVFILGFIYTIFNVKVPYIPTPKQHDPKNEFVLGIPNLIMALICVVAAIYGLYSDWHPYSFMMAGFSLMNATILLLAFAMGQTSFISHISKMISGLDPGIYLLNLRLKYQSLERGSVRYLILFPISISLFAVPFSFMENTGKNTIIGNERLENDKDHGAFYSGIYTPLTDKDGSLEDVIQAEELSNHSFSVLSGYLAWGADSLPVKNWQKIADHGAIPMIIWEPWTNLFPEYAGHPDLSNNRKVFHYITEGYFDDYIDKMAVSVRSLHFPVFLRFAHEMDNPMYPWSATGGNSPEEFIAAWRYVHDRFEQLGVQNVSWVWNPWKASAMESYFPSGKHYPESRYVDWVGLTCLNYGKANPDQRWYSFEELYDPFRRELDRLAINLPVMLSEFGSVSYGGDGTEWVIQSLEKVKKKYPEVKAAVLFFSNQDKNWVTSWRPEEENESKGINWTYNIAELKTALAKCEVQSLSPFKAVELKGIRQQPKGISGSNGNFSWIIKNQPFYFKGVCYNPEHDWRDGFLPLTRKQLEKDFRKIKEMGANTIRRYEPGMYDENIITIAEETGLHVLYGFWFDPAVDYYQDKAAVKKYEEKVLKNVRKYKHRKSIIAWNIGNETWGLLKQHYTRPYLTLNRRAYLNFLEGLAQKIKEIDPDRPVFATEEHEYYQLAATVYEMKTHVPSVDVIGINSYYEVNIGSLQSVFTRFDTTRPYVVTEFGPKGYWSHEFGDYRNETEIIELSGLAKAEWYHKQWRDYIEPNKGYNLGGFAFSWRDRYEGTATWYGITDIKGRVKPAYYYLQQAWAANPDPLMAIPDVSIVGGWYPQKPGSSLWLAAAISNEFSEKLTFEWEVLEEFSWKKIPMEGKNIMEKKYMEFQIPDKKGSYRVYLYASDSAGNVVTASRPLLVQ